MIKRVKTGGAVMSNYNATTEADSKLMKLAKKRVRAKREFVWNLACYVLVNTFLVLIYFITDGPFGYFWPIWPIMGWGLGVALHGVSVILTLSDTAAGSEDRVLEEYNKLKRGEMENTDELASLVKDVEDDRSN